MIPGGALVRKDVPPYILPAGNPLAYNSLNNVGLTRRGFTSEQISPIKEAYEIIFRSGKNTTQAVNYIREEMQITPEIQAILDFIKRADRGIIRGNHAKS